VSAVNNALRHVIFGGIIPKKAVNFRIGYRRAEEIMVW
jgi:hypothetical protein